MIIERVWAMPSRWTFTIKPIKDLLKEEIDDGIWIDPFAGENSPATITNDLNPDRPTDYHMNAIDFLRMFEDGSVDGVLYDRSEEHTSELQSRFDLVCRLLLEK